MEFYRAHVLICAGAGCISSNCLSVKSELQDQLKANGLDKEVMVVETGCIGSCDLGPVLIVYPEGTFYCSVKAADVQEIVSEHILKGRPVERLMYKVPATDTIVEKIKDIDFFKGQTRIALRNTGVINPDKIEEYIARNGYASLGKALTQMKPEEVIDEVKRSGLRGRGGGGFPTGTKWELASKSTATPKYVVCNADEGDPGAFMDRSVLEGDPHSLIEAMTIAGYAIGANQGYVYVRAEYPLAVERLGTAIEQARSFGFLGENIFNTGFNFDLEIRVGAGAFVCGEETALLTSIEGHRGEPRPRPPFPAVKGLFGQPTLLNNVETYANIPPIILNGAGWFTSHGTAASKGTKVFALAGDIVNTGLVEVPMGTTLREIIFNIGGGILKGKRFKAAQTGGPSGGCIPESLLDIMMEYDTLIKIGSMMGSGGLIVMDEDTCMVDVARYFLDFTVDESCGKCAPCRIGTKRMLEILERITSGEGKDGDIELLERLARDIKATALCGLGQTAPNPVLSTLRFFRDEYEAHIYKKTCPAGVCQNLLKFTIMEEKCKACGICAKICPANAISKGDGKYYVIDNEKCITCGACVKKCPFDAIGKGA